MANVEFEDFSTSVKDLMSELLGNALEEVGAEIESQAAKNTRVDGGETKRKWDHLVEQNEQEAKVTVGNPLKNAIWEEFGEIQCRIKIGQKRRTLNLAGEESVRVSYTLC